MFFVFINVSYAGIIYKLDVSIDTQNGSLKAAATIKSDRPEKIKVYTDGLDVTAVLYGKEKLPTDRGVYRIDLQPEKELTIIYSLKLQDYSSEDIITDEAVSLIGNWYPFLDKPAVYRLRAEVPDGFVMVSEAESWKIENEGTKYTFNLRDDILFIYPHQRFPQPAASLPDHDVRL